MKNTEYDNFDRAMRKLLVVPHSTIKAKLDAEKKAKAAKKRKRASRASSAKL